MNKIIQGTQNVLKSFEFITQNPSLSQYIWASLMSLLELDQVVMFLF